jgi:hypothetical protein
MAVGSVKAVTCTDTDSSTWRAWALFPVPVHLIVHAGHESCTSIPSMIQLEKALWDCRELSYGRNFLMWAVGGDVLCGNFAFTRHSWVTGSGYWLDNRCSIPSRIRFASPSMLVLTPSACLVQRPKGVAFCAKCRCVWWGVMSCPLPHIPSRRGS